jgi:hypothetical protein
MFLRTKLTWLIFFISISSFAQTFTRSYGGTGNEYGRWITQTPDSGFAIGGTSSTFSNGANDLYLVRTDKFGDTLWTRHFGGTANELFASVEVCADSGFVLAGTTYSFGTGTPTYSNWYVVRTDKHGNTLWTNTYGVYTNDLMYHAKPTADGGLLLMGYSDQGGWAKGTVIKTNAAGSASWTYYMGSSGNSYAYESLQDTNGQYICTGSTLSGTFQVLLQRVSTSGTVLYSKTYHSSGQYADGGISIVPAHGGGFMVLGLYGNYGSYNVWLLRVDQNLDTLWTRKLPGILSVGQLWVKDASIARCSDGYVLCGSGITSGHTDVKLIKVDTAGNQVWTKYYGGPGEHYGFKVISTNDNGLAACGYDYNATNTDFFIVKTDSAGDIAPPIPPVAFAGNNGSICAGDTFILGSSTAANYNSLRWSSSGTGHFSDSTILYPVYYPSAADQTAGSVVLSLNALASGYTAALSTCTLTIYPLPVPQITGLNTAFCIDALPVQASGLPSGGTFSGTAITPSGYFTPGNAAPGALTVTYHYTHPLTTCSSNDSLTITIHPLPAISVSNPSPLGICPGDTVQLSATLSQGASCHWLWNGNAVPGSQDSALIVSDTGYYQAVALSSQGCRDTSAQVDVFFHPVPVVSLGQDTVVCSDEAVWLDAGAGQTAYLWSTGASTQSILFDSTGLGVGNHHIWVNVSNSFGCSASDTMEVVFVDCTGIMEPDANHGIIAYPNPFSNYLIIHHNATISTDAIISILDVNGRTVMQEKIFAPSTILYPGHLPPGVYFLIFRNDPNTSPLKIVKQD